jgi:hypothetical protein
MSLLSFLFHYHMTAQSETRKIFISFNTIYSITIYVFLSNTVCSVNRKYANSHFSGPSAKVAFYEFAVADTFYFRFVNTKFNIIITF